METFKFVLILSLFFGLIVGLPLVVIYQKRQQRKKKTHEAFDFNIEPLPVTAFEEDLKHQIKQINWALQIRDSPIVNIESPKDIFYRQVNDKIYPNGILSSVANDWDNPENDIWDTY